MFRLINIHSLEVALFHEKETPPYAIASHRWQEDEVTLRDLLQGTFDDRNGFAKLAGFCKFLRSHSEGLESILALDIQWLWIDACCIDQQNASEVSETINTMFTLYAEAAICLAYLFDVAEGQTVESSSWFERGWTLQELLSPSLVLFLDCEWHVRGHKFDTGSESQLLPLRERTVVEQELGPSLVESLAFRTGISVRILTNLPAMENQSCFDVFYWKRNRVTRRPEDEAYCLLGLFDVSMPLIYGERGQAIIRLMQHIQTRLKQQISASERYERDFLSPQARLLIEQQVESLDDTISQLQHDRRTRRLQDRTFYAQRIATNVSPFNILLRTFNKLQQRTMTENLEMQKAQAFWNPLEMMSECDAGS